MTTSKRPQQPETALYHLTGSICSGRGCNTSIKAKEKVRVNGKGIFSEAVSCYLSHSSLKQEKKANNLANRDDSNTNVLKNNQKYDCWTTICQEKPAF